ncbi:MAG: DUF4340 domain-containing protein [Aristaeellaceae bacterium]
MQHVQKKRRPGSGKQRIALLIAALLTLIVLAAALFLLRREEPQALPEKVSTAENLFAYAPSEVASITIRRGEEAPWTVVQGSDGLLTLTGEDGFTLSAATSAALLDAAYILPCEEVLSTDPAEYADHLADFGLNPPQFEAIVTYTDGVTAHLRIGNPGTENNAWYYMTVDGDDRLFAFSQGMMAALFVSRESLWQVVSPTIHKARIDRVTLTSPEQALQWELASAITDADAADKWRITSPFTYPADADAMASLLSNLANLRLGAYVAPATEANLTKYGFDTPRLTIDIHMAAGAIAVTNGEGAVEPVDYPAGTVTFVIGGQRNDLVDYVRFEDNLYVSSHFTMGVFLDVDVFATMSRYPVMTALGNLASLSLQESDAVTEYILTRTEQVAENNELITDAEGNPIYDVTVTRNGDTIDYAAFEAAYNALTLVTVSGTLPAGEAVSAPHTTYTFTDVDGTVHVVALATFDALHDAVIVDGHPAFYLIKGGFKLNLD